MGRVVLFHWNAAEAEERADRLRRAGHEVSAMARVEPQVLRALRDDPPDAFVIDLARLPRRPRRDGHLFGGSAPEETRDPGGVDRRPPGRPAGL